VTLDRDGIVWADREGRMQHFPVRPRQVFDITGAGDMVISTLGYCLAAGADWPEAIELANLAGGLEVERLGVVPLTRQEILAELRRDGGTSARKILSLDQLDDELHCRRQAGARIVMTNGCFDLLHPGHVASLEQARKLGDCLLVGVNSDRSVCELKGPGRPIVDEQGRAAMLAALGCVDYVVVFDDVSVTGLVERVLPDVLVKAAQYGVEEVVGHEIVEQHGGQVVLAPMKPAYSTSALVEKIGRLAAVEGEGHACRCEETLGIRPCRSEGPAEAA
jgi:D-beta-D-heptose 7-phosphate kinase/D-beta-D-heptose 1-phosphate adenosyltransferase